MLFLIKKFLLQKFFFLRFKQSNEYNFIFFSKNFKMVSKPYITFDLSNRKVFHNGDSLFFEPSINLLNKFYKVEVFTKNKFMKSYFKYCGYKVVNKINSNSNLIISFLSKLMLNKRLNTKQNYIAINIYKLNSKKKLNEEFFIFFKNYFHLNFDKPILPKRIITNKSKYNFKFEYLILNDEIYSSVYMKIFKNFNHKFKSILNKFKKKYKIIRIGNKKNNEFSDEIFLDLTNKTNMLDVISLIRSKYCVGTISFDNFIMHLSCIYMKKKIFVIERGRIFKSNQIRRLLIPFFNNKKLKKKIRIIK